jgi:hypothetical protein
MVCIAFGLSSQAAWLAHKQPVLDHLSSYLLALICPLKFLSQHHAYAGSASGQIRGIA